MNYSETLKYISSLGNFYQPAGLDRIKKITEKLGNPQDAFKSVHIAGTNGKGSTCTMLAEIFQAAGYKTGRYISPYVIDFRERIQINGEFISENDIVKYGEKVKSIGLPVSEFEFITALAFLYFKENNCDIVIVETGMGGRLDATNVFNKPQACVITKIGLDHSEILGDTEEKIAAEKCGIIKKNVPVISYCDQPKQAEGVIKEKADIFISPDLAELKIINCGNSGSTFIYKDEEYNLSLIGKHQIYNALTVIETLNAVGEDIPVGTIKNTLEKVTFPARAEIINISPFCILDGAHNPDGAKALAEIMKGYDGKITAVTAVMRDKDYPAVLAETLKYCRNAVTLAVKDMPRSLEAQALKEEAEKYCTAYVAEDYKEAVKKAFDLAEGNPVFVFGSLYLASGIRDVLKDFYKNL